MSIIYIKIIGSLFVYILPCFYLMRDIIRNIKQWKTISLFRKLGTGLLFFFLLLCIYFGLDSITNLFALIQ